MGLEFERLVRREMSMPRTTQLRTYLVQTDDREVKAVM